MLFYCYAAAGLNFPAGTVQAGGQIGLLFRGKTGTASAAQSFHNLLRTVKLFRITLPHRFHKARILLGLLLAGKGPEYQEFQIGRASCRERV